jgi:hypothetical protein
MRSTVNDKGQTVIDYEKMSNTEINSLLKERYPAVAETFREVKDTNREEVIAVLNFLSNESEHYV